MPRNIRIGTKDDKSGTAVYIRVVRFDSEIVENLAVHFLESESDRFFGNRMRVGARAPNEEIRFVVIAIHIAGSDDNSATEACLNGVP